MDFVYSFFAVAEKVGLLFILIAVSFLCQRIRLLTEEANKCLGDLIIYVVNPCVIINAFSSTVYSRAEIIDVLKNIGLSAVIDASAHIIMILAVHLIFRFRSEDRRRLMRFAAVFSNAGFIALPPCTGTHRHAHLPRRFSLHRRISRRVQHCALDMGAV